MISSINGDDFFVHKYGLIQIKTVDEQGPGVLRSRGLAPWRHYNIKL
jgi:hypothetical protein